MLSAIIARDVPNSVALRPSVRPRHLAYLQPLVDQEIAPALRVQP
jgi:uncharacterized protein YciI